MAMAEKRSKMKIKAVLFDIDGTLINSHEAITEYFQDFIERAGYERPSKKTASQGSRLVMKDRIRLITGEKSEERLSQTLKIGKN